jgi:CxxC motif-containing protein
MKWDEKRSLTCIVCPNGCRLTVEKTAEGLKITGNQCKRGIGFAEAEMTHPTRTLTTTVRTIFPEAPVVSVRTRGEIPKDKIREVMAFLNTITVQEPLGVGAAVAENVLGLGKDVIVTSDILRSGL